MQCSGAEKPNIEAVYSKYADTLYRVALSTLQNDMDAQDAVQDVFMKYMSAKPEFGLKVQTPKALKVQAKSAYPWCL